MRTIPGILLALAACGGVAVAQPYSIDWYTFDGGGGASSGGSYTVGGTFGQPDAGTVSGGSYTLQGGFWPGLIVTSTGPAPTMLIQLSGANVIISWSPATAGFALEQTDSLAVPSWSSGPSGNPTAPITPSAGARFYRLRKP
jgi:hypothetical protein